MTSVTVERARWGIARITVSGHAGYADAGEDIVCAGVSALIITCANALQRVAGVEPVIRSDDQNAVMSVAIAQELPDGQRHDAQIILETTAQGLEDISSSYPDHLTCTTTDWRASQ